jgi:hypothetical protein
MNHRAKAIEDTHESSGRSTAIDGNRRQSSRRIIEDTHDSSGRQSRTPMILASGRAIKDTHDSGVWSTGASTASTPSRDVREVDSAAQGVSRDPAQR